MFNGEYSRTFISYVICGSKKNVENGEANDIELNIYQHC